MNTAVWSSSLRCAGRPDRRSRRRALDRDRLEAGHRGAGRIGAVGAVGDEHLGALLAAIAEVGRGDQQRRQFAVRTGGRLQRHGRQARRSRPASAAARTAVRSMPCSVVFGLIADADRPCPAARPAARSASGCTSSCTSRADRSACRSTCSASTGSRSAGRLGLGQLRQRRRRVGQRARPAAVLRPARSGTSHAGNRTAAAAGLGEFEQQLSRSGVTHELRSLQSSRPVALQLSTSLRVSCSFEHVRQSVDLRLASASRSPRPGSSRPVPDTSGPAARRRR